MEKERLRYFDYGKGVGIVLVVVGHSTFLPPAALAYISAFHMPLFFVISGMLLGCRREEERPLRDTARRKARSILIPYVMFTAAYLIIDIADMYLKLEPLTWADIAGSLVEFVTLYGMSVLWFLPALYFGELLYLGGRKLCRRSGHPNLALALTLLAAIVVSKAGSSAFHAYYPLDRNLFCRWMGYYILVILRSICAFCYLCIGGYIYNFWHERADLGDGEKRRVLFRIAEIAWGVFLLAIVGAVSRFNGTVDIRSMTLNNPALFYLGGTAGTLGVLHLCRNIRRCFLLRCLGENSLIVMATHLDFQVMYYAHRFGYGMKQFVKGAEMFFFYFHITAAVLLAELFLIYVINRWFPFFLGKKPRR